MEDESRIQVDQRVFTEKGPMKTFIFLGSNLRDVDLPILGEVSGTQDPPLHVQGCLHIFMERASKL